MPGDSHEADHLLRRVLPAYSFSFGNFLSSEDLDVRCQQSIPLHFGSSWLQSDRGFYAPAALQSGRLQTRMLLNAPPGLYKITVYLRVVYDAKKSSSDVIGSGKKAFLKLPTSSYGSITIGAQQVPKGPQNNHRPPQQFLPSGFVEKALRYNPDESETNLIVSLDTPIKLLDSQSLEIHIRSAYNLSIFKAGSPFKWHLDYIGISQFGNPVQLANAGEINRRKQFLEAQKKQQRDQKIDRALKYATNGLTVATMGTGLARQGQGLAAMYAKKKSYQAAELANYGSFYGATTPHLHGSASLSDTNLGHHQQQILTSGASYYANAWEADSQAGFDQSTVGSDSASERPPMTHYATDPLPFHATLEQFEYSVADDPAAPGQEAASVTYSRWDAVG